MLTDEKLESIANFVRQRHGHLYEGTFEWSLIKEIRTLQQQNSQLIEAVHSAINHLNEGELFIRSSQMSNRLISILGESE